ncbi:MAG: tyrosine-protein phosphatase [Opitutales bacterium]|nr:tyrosine-protein phosphatase [Opitutales bacterium]
MVFRIFFAAMAVILFPRMVTAAIVPVTPHETDAVSGVAPILKNFLLMPPEERQVLFDNKDYRQKLNDLRDAEPTLFTWECTDGETGTFELVLSTAEDLSEPTDVFVYPKTPDGNVIRAVNFRTGTTYYWRIRCKSDDGTVTESPISKFTSDEKMPRLMRLNGIGNVRDLGGRKALRGVPVKQGMIFRSATLVENSPDFKNSAETSKSLSDFERGKVLLDPAAATYAVEILKWRTELDLRCDAELGGQNASAIPGVNYINIFTPEYCKIFSAHFSPSKQALSRAFRVFCDEKNYPVLFHSYQGADRAGTLAFILNGLLGVSPNELQKDWEISAGTHLNYKDFFTLLHCFDDFGDRETLLSVKIERYLKTCGITQGEIDEFRRIMLSN